MTHSTSHLKRLKTRAVRKYEKRLRKESKAERKSQMEILFKMTHLSKASFGSHWKWINQKIRRGKWVTQDLVRACAIIKKLPNFDLNASSIEKAYLLEMVTDHRHLKTNAWYKSVDRILKKLSKQKGATRDDQKRKVSANSDAPRSPSVDNESANDESIQDDDESIQDDDESGHDDDESIQDDDESVENDSAGDENDRHNEIASPKSFLGLLNGTTGREDPLRENPGTNVNQTHIRFPDGERLFPEFLVCPSTQIRANLEAPVMAFVIAAMISQLPESIPSHLRRTIIDNMKKTDIRLKPSGLPFMDRIKKASKTEESKVALTDVIQGLAHAHWKVGKTGAYSFFYNSLRALGMEVVVDYDFDWSNIQGNNVHDSEGNELRICADAPAPRRKIADHHRKRFEELNEGKKLLADKNFTFEGCDEDGGYVYTTHNVVFKGTQQQLDELLGHQASFFDARYRTRFNARDAVGDAPASASDQMADDEDNFFTF